MRKTKAAAKPIADILNNSTDRAILQQHIDEAVRCKVRISDEQESIKALREVAVDKIQIEPKMFNQLLALFYNNNFVEKKAELENLDIALDLIMLNNPGE